MKTLGLFLLLTSSVAFAGQEVDLFCYGPGPEGSVIEVGVSLEEFGRINAKVIERNGRRRTLLLDEEVDQSSSRGMSVFFNGWFKLRVSKMSTSNPTAYLSLLDDGPRSLSDLKLQCFKDRYMQF